MIESLDSADVKRNQFFERFVNDLEVALISPNSSIWVIDRINYVFVKLRRLIKNHSELNNKEFQWKIFADICKILNSINSKFFVWNFHNSISNTSLEKYKNMTLWEQFCDVAYGKFWDFDYDCKWWDCAKYTLSFYIFFELLKEAWLDLEVSIYRLKNIDDIFLWMNSFRHSWLLINFQWKDYMLDYTWINDVFSKTNTPVIQSVDSLLDSVKRNENIRKLNVTDFWNLDCFRSKKCEKSVSREDSDNLFVYFSNVEDFLEDVKNYPSPKRISFVELNSEWKSTRFSYWFFWEWVCIEINNDEFFYFLKNDAQIDRKSSKFFESFVENIEFVVYTNDEKENVSEKSRNGLLRLLKKIENDINFDCLISIYC